MDASTRSVHSATITALPMPSGAVPHAERMTDYTDPFRFESRQQFAAMMLEAHAHGAADVYVQPGQPIVTRIQGRMKAITWRALDENEVKFILKTAINRDTALTDILSGRIVEGRYELFDPTARDHRGARVRYGYRVNASPIQYCGGTGAQIVMRAIPTEPPTYDQLGMSLELVQNMTPRDGIVYIAGATGSGKTTTFASVIRYVLENDTPIHGNIITHEEPIEFTYDTIISKHSIIVQSQIPQHFATFYDANRAAMRRKPALIMFGELRDEETIRSATEASLTGHPVFGTVHAVNVPAIWRRLISRFPEAERSSAIYDLVETARFMMAQRLVIGTNGRQLAAREWLVLDEATREELIGLEDMGRVTSAVKQIVAARGHSFAKEAERLLQAGLIDEKVARDLAHT